MMGQQRQGQYAIPERLVDAPRQTTRKFTLRVGKVWRGRSYHYGKCHITGPDGILWAYAAKELTSFLTRNWVFYTDESKRVRLLDTRAIQNSGATAVVDARYGTILGAVSTSSRSRMTDRSFDVFDSSLAQIGRIIRWQIEIHGKVIGQIALVNEGIMYSPKLIEVDLSANDGRIDERLAVALALITDIRAIDKSVHKSFFVTFTPLLIGIVMIGASVLVIGLLLLLVSLYSCLRN